MVGRLFWMQYLIAIVNMQLFDLISMGLWLVVSLSLPVISVTVIIGIVISLIQAMMQIQDQALPFFLKLISASLTLYYSASWYKEELTTYTRKILEFIAYQ